MRLLATVLAVLVAMVAGAGCVLAAIALHQPLLTVGAGCLAAAAMHAALALMDPPAAELVSRPVVLS